MSFIRQEHKTDCGIACLAMLCDATYEEAYAAIPNQRKGQGTYAGQLREGAICLGYETRSTLQNRMRPIKRTDPWSAGWEKIPDNSLVKIPSYGGLYHWVVWTGKIIYDPARGAFLPTKYDKKPSSYMEFIKCTR